MEPDAQVKAERIQQFQGIAGEELDAETCEALLASNDWNVESTVRNFFEGPASPRLNTANNINNAGFTSEPGGLHDFDFEEDNDDETTAFMGDEGVRARRGRGVSPERDNIFAGSAATAPPRNRPSTLPPVPARSLTAILREALTGHLGESSASAARKFASEFDRVVGPDSNVPEFFESSFEDALLSASIERRLLAVYLHSPQHPYSEQFCRDVLCSRAVLNAIADVRVWGGSIEHSEGYLASAKVQAAGFPCVVLIATDRGRDAKIVDRIYVDDINEPNLPERFAARIVAARNVRATAPSPAIDPRVVDERRRVVEEQDAALRSAMEQDRKREEEKRKREMAEEAERQRKREEEEKKLEELSSKRARVREEPAAGSSNITTLRFQFPGGSKLSRRFADSDTVGYVRDILDVYLVDQLKTEGLRYALVLNYPKKTLEDNEASLKDAGLVPQAVLFLQDLDA